MLGDWLSVQTLSEVITYTNRGVAVTCNHVLYSIANYGVVHNASFPFRLFKTIKSL